ncbi:DNA mismatch repair protein [Streptococcus equi subsp. zooepidemicus Sz105]|uniref:endonuclease MutS2 n=1 Tax=Streptococcus equi TaxID=1336 RepID=UPI0005BE5F0E|nr:endonuclease MutS2 [Streptococcus equi]KIS14704.1 DNA mismatch repair protein [Streptococcus equi subsp. zooepidemicus Sz105]MDI5987863.1 endonuclease MutS2 [Streptococcus equi subsp. zooepidemicus]HEL0558664.1 endonuclease MutS2 [Streptococcus equi subsp. zooepidemicus]HEL0585870.1 endonuclease MutS2 [Streptococcus equi subsp. zooepidemicus]HEL0607661.1 endonuclease MutS2 [Streptococcus equi subsp. zooepidemicus]
MEKKILEQLEFDKVKEQFWPYLQTEQGQLELDLLEPIANKGKIQAYFTELEEMAAIFVEHHHFALGGLSDVSESMQRLDLEADLSIQELLAVKKLLQVSAEVCRFYADLENVDLVALKALFEKIESFPSLQGSLQAINDAGFVEGFASPELESIRRQISNKEHASRQLLQDILKKQAAYLSESLIASRNGRSVLPVKNTYRHKVAGVVHDMSASGSTVYIEPRALVSLNEELTQLQADERHEIGRILYELSEQLRPHSRSLRNNAWLLGHLDLVRAKYLYMQAKQATVPVISDDKSLQLLNARHPLIQNPVANDLHFANDLAVIVITGPNTGGKTIMLKTLGLAQVMAQSGLPILADKGSRVAVFNGIYADIGDEQSIEQSLSTFSSHMTHIVEILNQADSDSLILFDELGAGTDPQEGASLAMAILEQLRLTNIKTMATTHYPELKAYGIETAYVENASMAFDNVSLKPTYRFMQGVPGRSNAFDIARRLGLAEHIVKEAQAMTATDHDVNRIIEQLEQQTLESRKRLEHIKEVEQDNLKFNRAVKKLYNEFSHAKDKELEKAALEAREIVDIALAESDSILSQLHEKAELKPHEIIEAKHRLKQLAPEQSLSQNKVLKKAKKWRAPRVGDDIIVTAYGQRGTLLAQLKDKRWEAQVGLIKLTLKEDEFSLVKLKEEAQQPKKRAVKVVKKAATGKEPRARLDLRGKRYEEAMQELDAFIDQALLNNMSQVDIIHGIGTGVIREAVGKYLRRNKHVKSFGYAPQNAGGSGCTIANLG